ncbi:MAG TPA: response regulator [Thermoanaerobaculia bacterium]|nr:response regulator [Thermoanaerobaculia bacterium]
METAQKKVLVVENDEVIIVLISHILTRSSYSVQTTLDALEVDDLLASNEYDAILLDLKMPHGGVDLIRRIEKRNPALLSKIIVVSGAIDELHKIAGMPLYAIIRKPFEIDALLETVRSCVAPAE